MTTSTSLEALLLTESEISALDVGEVMDAFLRHPLRVQGIPSSERQLLNAPDPALIILAFEYLLLNSHF